MVAVLSSCCCVLFAQPANQPCLLEKAKADVGLADAVGGNCTLLDTC